MPEALSIFSVYERTEKAISDGQLDLADRLIWPAIDQYPHEPGFWFMAGNIAWKREQNTLAKMCYEESERVGGNINPHLYTNLGAVYRRLNRHADCIGTLTKAVVLDPDNAVAYCNLTSAYVNEGDPKTGIAHARRALEMAPDSQKTRWNLGLLLLEDGQFEEGWEMYRTGLSSGERMLRRYDENDDHKLLTPESFKALKKRRFKQSFAGKPTLVVWGEQGMGDELMFGTCLKEAAEYFTIIYECHPRLATLLAESDIDMDLYPTRKDDYIDWAKDRKIDYKCAIGDLPMFFRQKEKDFTARPDHVRVLPNAEYRSSLVKRFGDRPIVGIANYGGSPKTMATYRRIDPVWLAQRLPKDYIYVIMEYLEPMGQEMVKAMEEAGLDFDYPVGALTHHDYIHTAGIAQACDEILSVNTSLVHLNGVLGKRTHVLTPKRPAWRYGVREELQDMMYWYPGTHYQFRQSSEYDWQGPVDAAIEHIHLMIGKREAAA